MVKTTLPVQKMSVGDSYYYCDKYRSLFEEGCCYNNSFALMAELFKAGIKTTCQIGYILSSDGETNMAVRHCWLKENRHGSIIDVSVPVTGFPVMSAQNLRYAPVLTLSPAQWLERIDSDNGSLDVWENDKEDEVVEVLKTDGFEVKRVKAIF